MSNDSKAERLANAKANVRRLQRELEAAQRFLVKNGGERVLLPCCAHHRSALGLIKGLIEGRGFRSVEREVLQLASDLYRPAQGSNKP